MIQRVLGTRDGGGWRGEGVVGTDDTGALPALLIPLSFGPDTGWPPWVWASFTTAGVLGAFLFAHERGLDHRGRDPFLPPSLLCAPGFPAGLAQVVAFFAGGGATARR